MVDRRKGTTLFWEFFWKLVYGERRTGTDRRRSKAEEIVFGCGGNCQQGRRECDCRPKVVEKP